MKSLQSPLLSIGQLALRLGVCVGTIRRWCREGKLKETARTAGNHRRFAFDAFEHLTILTVKSLAMLGYQAMTRKPIWDPDSTAVSLA